MLDIKHLKELIDNKKAKEIVEFIKQNNIIFENNKLIFSKEQKQEEEDYWDKRQLVRKINLNSLDLGRV